MRCGLRLLRGAGKGQCGAERSESHRAGALRLRGHGGVVGGTLARVVAGLVRVRAGRRAWTAGRPVRGARRPLHPVFSAQCGADVGRWLGAAALWAADWGADAAARRVSAAPGSARNAGSPGDATPGSATTRRVACRPRPLPPVALLPPSRLRAWPAPCPSAPCPDQHAGAGGVPPRSTMLWVGRIAATVEAPFVEQLLAACGKLRDWKPVTEPESGKLKGFGFVTFEEPEGVLVALRVLNNLRVDGQELALKCNNVRGVGACAERGMQTRVCRALHFCLLRARRPRRSTSSGSRPASRPRAARTAPPWPRLQTRSPQRRTRHLAA